MTTAIHPPRTGLERRFEDELQNVPGWHPWTEGIPSDAAHHPRKSTPRENPPMDRQVESQMILGR